MIITSLSPSHKNKTQQIEAVNSWQKYGECYSVNSEEEIAELRENYPGISFLKTIRTVEALYGSAPRVNINALIDTAKDFDEDLILINSDIIIEELPKFRTGGLTIFSRYDYSVDKDKSEMFTYGFDMFYIPKALLHVFPPSIYALGACFFDLSLPYRFILNKIPVFYPPGKFIFHKNHPQQYSQDEWYFLGKYFRWEFRLDETTPIERMTQITMDLIKHNLRA